MRWAWILLAWCGMVMIGVPTASAQEDEALAPPLPSSAAATLIPTTATPASGDSANPDAALPADAASFEGEKQFLPEDCEGTNRALLITSAVIDVGTLFAFLLAFWFASSKDWILPGGAVRYFVVLLPFLIIPAALIHFLRPDAEIVAFCVSRVDYRNLILLVEQPSWVQCAALGTAPVFAVAFLLPIISAPFRRRR